MTGFDFDSVVEKIGSRGRYQKRVLFLVCLPAAVLSTFLVFSNVFVLATPDHWCARRNATEEYDRPPECVEYDDSGGMAICRRGWEYDRRTYEETLVTEFDLVCDKSWMPPLSTSLFYAGSLLGNGFFGWASDRWGRRTVFYPMLVSELFLSLLTSLALDFWSYAFLRTLRGLFYPAIFQQAFIIGLEVMGSSERSLLTWAMCSTTALSGGALAMVAMFFRTWRPLCLAASLPLLPLLAVYRILPESPRWLLAEGKLEEAKEVITKMADVNGVPLPPDCLDALQEPRPSNERSASPLDLVRFPSIRYKYLIVLVNWIACAIAYNSLAYYTVYLGIDDYLAFAFNALVELPSYALMGWLMDRSGRRPSLSGSMLVGGAACLCTSFVPEARRWLLILLVLLGKLGCSAAFAVFYVYVAELLPTTLRSQAMGVGSFVSGLVLLGFPYVVSLADRSRTLPVLVIGVLSFFAGLLATLLPETNNSALLQFAPEARLSPDQRLQTNILNKHEL